MGYNDILKFLIRVLVLFTAFPVHELAHAWAADKMGDHTARYQGRITLNPFAHLDLMGTLMMFIVGVGWAKPVPINPNNFKNRKVGMALSSLAGPMSNVLMAFLAMIVYRVLTYQMRYGMVAVNSDASQMIIMVFYYIVVLNIGLAVFNLLPIPPLDGSRIATLFLPEKTYFNIMQYERYIFMGLMVVMLSGILDTPLTYLRNNLFEGLSICTEFVDKIMGVIIK